LWSLLGPKPVDLLAWESFGEDWVTDVAKQLKLKDARIFKAPYGGLPDLKAANSAHDIVFVWNGTTSGVRVPNGDWIADNREGLTICDATSAAFAQDLAWGKLDVATFSWQKALGSEGAHGMLVLSPRAAARMESYEPPWPMPKTFRMTKDKKLVEGIFEGDTINTPSMLALEDYLDALKWAETIGGLSTLFKRADDNLAALAAWVERTPWVGFLSADPKTRSNTSVCFKIVDPWFTALAKDAQAAAATKLANILEKEGVAFDIGGYRSAPPGLRIWCGATVEKSEIEQLTPWLDWAFAETKAAAR
jgi:phosphoserine aminotransferase